MKTISSSSTVFKPGHSILELRRHSLNIAIAILVTLALCFTIAVLLYLLFYVLVQGIRYLNLDFFINTPTPNGEAGGGMSQAIGGSAVLVGLASLMGVPLGLFTGIYLAEFGRGAFATSVRFLVDVLTGIPTIIFGLFAWTLIVIPAQSPSGLSGAVALGIIMIPIVTRTTEDVLRLVPRELREASLALGATQSRTILRVVLPAARNGLVTGVLLAMARVAGETAPLLMTAFGTNFWNLDITQPVDALPLRIYTFARSPFHVQIAQAYTGSFILILLIMLTSFIVRWATGGFRSTGQR